LTVNEISVLVGRQDRSYVIDAVVDYERGVMGEGFVVSSPLVGSC